MSTTVKKKKTPRSKPGEKLFRVGRAKTGLGLFATQPIPDRKLVIEYTGARIPTKRAREIDRARANKYLFEIDNRWTIDGAARTNTARYVNHSCDPNTEAESNRGRLMFRAIRDIAAGEEITLDYGEEHMELYFGKAGCQCPCCIEERRQIRAKARGKAQDMARDLARANRAR
jgi:hypothetical protein